MDKEESPEQSENKIEENAKPEFEKVESWDDFKFKTELLRGIYSYGFENPSEIQKKAILPIINGKDTIAQAQSGSGKTGTFSISSLQLIDSSSPILQAIIIAPTHELVKQISGVICDLGCCMEGLVLKTLIGGTSVQQDAQDIIKTPPQIIVGTAGRIYDMTRRKNIDLSLVKLFVLDEADEMLSRGFKEQIYNIFQYFNDDIQVALFSATMPEEIIKLAHKFMRDPVKITMKKEELNLECIQQNYVAVQNDYFKYDMLKHLFAKISVNQCIIYCNNVKRVIDLCQAMTDEGFSVCAIHSSINKEERDNIFRSFRGGQFRVLISSNITARGIDVQQVSTVINFDMPNCPHTYLHRIGRSGRWGRKGLAINFITKRDVSTMKMIENHYKITINELPVGNT
jgi:translation initiation factor 4A